MKNLFQIIIFVLLSGLSACDKDEPVNPTPTNTPKCWEQLVGNYVVYDTANSITYNMTISHKDSIQSNGSILDSLIITNYANRFNLRVGYGCYTISNLLKFVPSYPTYDHGAKRWSLTLNTDDTSTSKYENQLKNDTIILYYKLNNIAFYFADGVPFYAADETHIAVKQ